MLIINFSNDLKTKTVRIPFSLKLSEGKLDKLYLLSKAIANK